MCLFWSFLISSIFLLQFAVILSLLLLLFSVFRCNRLVIAFKLSCPFGDFSSPLTCFRTFLSCCLAFLTSYGEKSALNLHFNWFALRSWLPQLFTCQGFLVFSALLLLLTASDSEGNSLQLSVTAEKYVFIAVPAKREELREAGIRLWMRRSYPKHCGSIERNIFF